MQSPVVTQVWNKMHGTCFQNLKLHEYTKILHNVAGRPKIPFGFDWRDTLTCTDDGHQRRVMQVAAEICFDVGKCFFDWIVAWRVRREIYELAYYEKR